MKKMFAGSREQTAEVQLLWQCAETKCPHILPIVETYMEDDTCYIVTKFLAGGNLYEMMTKQPNKRLPEPIARKLFKKLALGLAGLKQRLIIHRDIKPLNILLGDQTSDANLYIADFGISALLRDEEDTRTLYIGTSGFTAPEVIKR